MVKSRLLFCKKYQKYNSNINILYFTKHVFLIKVVPPKIKRYSAYTYHIKYWLQFFGHRRFKKTSKSEVLLVHIAKKYKFKLRFLFSFFKRKNLLLKIKKNYNIYKYSQFIKQKKHYHLNRDIFNTKIFIQNLKNLKSINVCYF